VADEDPYRDPREGERIHAERAREEAEERSRFEASLRARNLSALNVAAIGVGLLLVGGLSVYQLDTAETALDAAKAAPSPAPPAARRMPPLACMSLVAEYHTALDKARACEKDTDCVAERRGEYMTGLDGCARFAAPSKDLLVADDRAAKWKAGGCAGEFRTCTGTPAAICEQHVCVEKPPLGLPRSWHRLDLPGVYSFFAPADVVDVGLGDLEPEDSWVTHFDGKQISIHFDVQRGAPEEIIEGGIPPSATDHEILRTEQLSLAGAPVRLDTILPPGGDANGAFSIHGWAPSVACQPGGGFNYYCSHSVSVGINAACKVKAGCDDLVKAIHSFEAW
jgi:hypothetical protein